jgi:hypothetical protein
MKQYMDLEVIQTIIPFNQSQFFESITTSHYKYNLYISNRLCLGTGQRSPQRHICWVKLNNFFPSAFMFTFTSQPSVFTEQTAPKIEPQLS